MLSEAKTLRFVSAIATPLIIVVSVNWILSHDRNIWAFLLALCCSYTLLILSAVSKSFLLLSVLTGVITIAIILVSRAILTSELLLAVGISIALAAVHLSIYKKRYG